MEKITVEFSASPSLSPSEGVVVVLTLDDNGKSYEVTHEEIFLVEQKELRPLPKRVLKAFTEAAINKILAKDKIPNESGMAVLDGFSYHIRITKGGLCKEYLADDASIETYPLLKYLASWCRR